MLKKRILNKTPMTKKNNGVLFSRTKSIAAVLAAMCLFLCVNFTFSWYGSTVEYLNTTINMGEFGAKVTVYNEKADVMSDAQTVGDDVTLDNDTGEYDGWAAGSVGYRLIQVKNTGTIDIISYLLSSFSLKGFVYDDPAEITDSFFFRITDVTDSVIKAESVTDYVKTYKTTAADIHKDGSSFTSFTEYKELGSTEKDKISYFIFDYCCYNLGQQKFTADCSVSMATTVSIKQANAPADDTTYTNIDSLTDVMKSLPEVGNIASTLPTTAQDDKPITPSAPATTDKPVNKPTEPTEDKKTADFEWSYTDSDKSAVAVTGYTGKEQTVVIPTEIDKLPVTELRGNVFRNTSVASVTIPATVGSVSANALCCDSLKTISFNKTDIVSGKTYDAAYSSDGTVVFNSDKTMLVRYLPQTEGTEYTVPPTVRMLAAFAFSNTKTLEKLNIANVSVIMSGAFSASSVKEIYLYGESQVQMLNFGIFAKDNYSGITLNVRESLKAAYAADKSFDIFGKVEAVLTPDMAHSAYSDVFGKVFISADGFICSYVTTADGERLAAVIGYSGDKAATELTVPAEVINENGDTCRIYKLADRAFSGMTELASVSLPSLSIRYTSDAFSGCDKLTSITCG